jgi:hypothetical protein
MNKEYILEVENADVDTLDTITEALNTFNVRCYVYEKEESTTIETWSTSNIKTLIEKIKDQVVNKKMDAEVSDILIRHFENVIRERKE